MKIYICCLVSVLAFIGLQDISTNYILLIKDFVIDYIIRLYLPLILMIKVILKSIDFNNIYPNKTWDIVHETNNIARIFLFICISIFAYKGFRIVDGGIEETSMVLTIIVYLLLIYYAIEIGIYFIKKILKIEKNDDDEVGICITDEYLINGKEGNIMQSKISKSEWVQHRDDMYKSLQCLAQKRYNDYGNFKYTCQIMASIYKLKEFYFIETLETKDLLEFATALTIDEYGEYDE